MKFLTTVFLGSILMAQTTYLFDFKPDSSIAHWRIINDGVMGGLSQGKFSLSTQGHGVFQGTISLDNNGGFSSLRHFFKTKDVRAYTNFVIRIKGDGKTYQFRAKTSAYDRHSYIGVFETTGDWQTVTIPMSSMHAAFRGRTLDIPNYPGESLEEITFLIGNKKVENFQLLIDAISLE